MKTDLSYIKKLIKLLEGSVISELEIEEEGTRLKLVKNKQQESAQQIIYAPPVQTAQTLIQPQPEQNEIASGTKTEEKPETKIVPALNIIEVRSPIVGTFYRAPSPEADPYVQVGQRVSKGNVLCIIEAMKLMNEIESEVEGKVVKILAENSQPVEYDQVLFHIEVS